MQMNPPTVSQNHVNAPSYDDLVLTLSLIAHATSPAVKDGAHHEAAFDLATTALNQVQARRAYEETLTGT